MKNIHTLTALFLICILTHSCDNKNTSGNKESPAAETPMQDTTQIDTSGKMVSRDTLSITRTKTIPLLLTVNELVSPKAPIRVAIYNSNENFLLKEGRIREFVIQPDGEKAMSEISDLEYGIYAIVVFQDLNNSGDMDKNLIGMPSEHYGLSNNYKPKIRKPTFDDCKFTYNSTLRSVSIDLQ